MSNLLICKEWRKKRKLKKQVFLLSSKHKNLEN